MKKMKTFCAIMVITISTTLISCDSSETTPTAVVPSTFEYLYIKSPATVSGGSTIWNLKNETTAGAGFASPTNLRTDTPSPGLSNQILMANQCSAYDKVNKKYAVSTGDRLVIYDVTNTASVPAPTILTITNIQAIEFVAGNLYVLKNYQIKKYNSAFVLDATFGPVLLPTTIGVPSNICFNGTDLYVTNDGKLHKISTVGAGTITSTSLSTTDEFDGLEYINTTALPNKLYAVKKGTSPKFVEIDPITGAGTIKYTLTYTPDFSRISSALDYSTEFYYLDSSNGFSSDQNSLTIIDLTPTGAYTPVPLTTPGNQYLFGLQLKD
ncbi:MAG: hypothetical protein KA523_07740 [Flavobacterium sp.]|nr:hypothetical protein [Flavobacterium sp.]